MKKKSNHAIDDWDKLELIALKKYAHLQVEKFALKVKYFY